MVRINETTYQHIDIFLLVFYLPSMCHWPTVGSLWSLTRLHKTEVDYIWFVNIYDPYCPVLQDIIHNFKSKMHWNHQTTLKPFGWATHVIPEHCRMSYIYLIVINDSYCIRPPRGQVEGNIKVIQIPFIPSRCIVITSKLDPKKLLRVFKAYFTGPQFWLR